MQGYNDPPELRGVIPHSFDHIFENIKGSVNTAFLVRCCYLEVGFTAWTTSRSSSIVVCILSKRTRCRWSVWMRMRDVWRVFRWSTQHRVLPSRKPPSVVYLTPSRSKIPNYYFGRWCFRWEANDLRYRCYVDHLNTSTSPKMYLFDSLIRRCH